MGALKFMNGVLVELTEEEEAAITAAVNAYNEEERKRSLTPNEVFELLAKSLVNTVSIDDQTSLRMKNYYPAFEELEGQEVDTGFKLTYKGYLWRVRQKHTVQSIYPPSVDTSALYERINETNTGTQDDPIPYDQTMEVFHGLYYSYDGVLYKCIRDSGLPLYAAPGDLIGNYFEKVEV